MKINVYLSTALHLWKWNCFLFFGFWIVLHPYCKNVGLVSKLTVSDDVTHFDSSSGKYLLIRLEREGERPGQERKRSDHSPSCSPSPSAGALKFQQFPQELAPHLWPGGHYIKALLLPFPSWSRAPAKVSTRLAGCPLPGKLKWRRLLVGSFSLHPFSLPVFHPSFFSPFLPPHSLPLPSLSFLFRWFAVLLISNSRPFFVFGKGSSFIVWELQGGYGVYDVV